MRPAAVFAFFILAIFTVPVLALECPVPAQFDDATTAAAVAKMLPLGIDLETPNALQSAIVDLRQAGVSEDLILDNLIASHCATVAAETGLSENEKAKRVDDFTTMAEPLVMAGPN